MPSDEELHERLTRIDRLFPKDGSRWTRAGHSHVYVFRTLRYGLVVMSREGRQNNADEFFVDWEDEEERELWSEEL